MRRPDKTFIFTVAVIAHAILGCEAMAEEFGLHPASKFQIAQGPAATSEAPLEELLARAEALSSSAKFLEAYELLVREEDAYIGVIEFDYALGRAALNAGRPDKATLAFSRVLALDPSHAGASIDIGRAYLALGDFARARAAFQGLLALDPPPPVRAQLQAYLAQTESRQADGGLPGGMSYQGYIAANLGRSTNVNQSPTQSQVFVPAIGSNFELSNQNVKKADGFASISAGLEAAQALDGTYSMIFGGEFVERRNFHEFSFDVGGVNLHLGLGAAMGAHQWRVQRLVGRDYLGGSASRDLDVFAFNYLGPLATDTQLLVSAQAGRLRNVPEGLRIFDADFVTWGLGAARKIAEQSTAFVIFSTGRQNDVGGNPSGDKRLLGARVGAEAAIQPRLKLTGVIAWERGNYNRFDEAFFTERRDTRWTLEAALQVALERNLFLRLGISHSDQRSNIPIYEYSRSEWWLMLRREFP
jgi:tetratricopeptide (TPR) repeat protein